MFNVGGCPELSSQFAEHNKPFEMDTKTEERGHYLSWLGRGTSERNNCGNVRRSYLHRLTLIITKDADVLGELMIPGKRELWQELTGSWFATACPTEMWFSLLHVQKNVLPRLGFCLEPSNLATSQTPCRRFWHMTFKKTIHLPAFGGAIIKICAQACLALWVRGEM